MPENKPPFDLVVGLDRSDRKADLYLIETATGQTQSHTLDTAPEKLRSWLLDLRQRYPQATVAICLEQPAGHLIAFLETYSWLKLYPINPISLQKYRETFVTSRAKDDGKDARYLAQLLRVASASVCDEGKRDGVECCAKSNEHYDQSKARRVGGKD